MRRAPLVLLAATVLAYPGTVASQDSSADYREPYQQKALEIYRTIIGFRSATGHGQVPALAGYLAQQFRAGGFSEEDVHVLPITAAEGEETAALVVRYRGNGASGLRPILLLAHMDVVDVRPEDWDRDPFTLVEENGYFFGRGTSDDKMGVAMLTTTYRNLTDAEFALNADAGGGVLAEDGDPLLSLVQTSEKTYATFELTVTNPGGHSSTPRPDNAIYDLAAALESLHAYRFPVQVNDATRLYFHEASKLTGGEVGEAMKRLADDPDDAWAAKVLWNEPEQVGITRTTCVATMLRAGHSENALPQSATATVNCRIFPGVSVQDVQEIRSGTPVIPYLAPYGTDGKAIRKGGIPTYGVMGLFMKDSDQFAHGLNERVPVRSFFDSLEFWHTVLEKLAGPGSDRP